MLQCLYQVGSMGGKVTAVALLVMLHLCAAARPKQKGIVPGPAGVFESKHEEKVMGYYDMDGNKQVDIITQVTPTANGESKLVIYLWNSKRAQYIQSGTHNLPQVSALVIDSTPLVGRQIITMHTDSINRTYLSLSKVQCSNYQCIFQQPLQIQNIETVDEVEPSIIKHDYQNYLLYSSLGEPSLVALGENITQSSTKLEDQTDTNGDDIQPYNFSYFGDYTGDCQADLILLGTHSQNLNHTLIQFMTGDKGQLSLQEQVAIQDTVYHFTVQDINFDGKPDLLLLLSGMLQIHYHKAEDKQLCIGSNHQVYDMKLTDDKMSQVQRIDLNGSAHSSSRLLFGDYDNDGYPDLILTLLNQHSQPRAALLRNMHCQDSGCYEFNPAFSTLATANTRTFKPKSIPVADVLRLSFIDIGQDGRLDWIAQLAKTSSLQPIYNNYDYDAFFLTAWLLEEEDVLIGGGLAVYVTLLSGQLAPQTASQLTQSGSALQLPYVHLGLGRTNNYLEEVTVNKGDDLEKWSPIIPNSNIILAYKGESIWVLDVLIEPTQKMAFVFLLVIVSLLVIGAVILHLTRKEKEQDKQNLESFYTFIG